MRSFLLICLISGVCLISLVPAGVASTWFIPDNFPDLRTAYQAVESHDTIIVRPGYYSGDNWTEIFFVNKPVRIVSEGGPMVTTIDGRGTDRGFLFQTMNDVSMLIDGFTITNCVGESLGAISFHENSSGTLRNCIIENCRTTGIYPPTPSEGAGIRILGASPLIENVTIRNCHSQQGGGCNILVNSSPVFRNVHIENCSGGGLLIAENCDPYFEDCQFVNCTSTTISFTAGVGIYTNSQGHFERCLFKGNNNLLDNAGGVHIGNSTTVFNQCMFINNTAVGVAGGILCHNGASPVFNYCTIAGNTAGTNGDGIAAYANSSPVFNSCIIWQPGSEIHTESGANATFSKCDISKDMGGDNFSVNPMFIDDDFHIDQISPCRDRGGDSGERIDIDRDWIEDPIETWDVGADEIFTPTTGNIALVLQMPQSMYLPGDIFRLDVQITNDGSGIYTTNLIVVLDVYAEYFFWPIWGKIFDSVETKIPSGSSTVNILPSFNWPYGAGSASNIYFHTGLMSQDFSEILSNIDTVTFGWSN